MAKALVAIDERKLANIRLHHARCGGADRLAARRLDRARRFALSRSVAEAPPLEAAVRIGCERGASLRAFCARAANSVSRPTGRTMPNGRLLRLLRARDFVWTAERADDWRKPWPGFAGTRYEAKAKREGRAPCYLSFPRGRWLARDSAGSARCRRLGPASEARFRLRSASSAGGSGPGRAAERRRGCAAQRALR